MAKKPRTHDDDDQTTDGSDAPYFAPPGATANQGESTQGTTSTTGGRELNYGNPPTGAGDPAPENQAEQDRQSVGDDPTPQGEPDAAHAPSQADLDADKEPLSKDEALQLLKAGHRLREKGQDPSHWIAMTRHGGDLAVSYAATEEEIEAALGDDLILAE
jgi:hypothetical protein